MSAATKFLAVIAAALLLDGCASLPPQRLDREIDGLTGSTGVQSAWRRDPAADQAAEERIGQLLADGLSVDEAETIGLLANPDLQVKFEELGFERADYLAAAGFPDPFVEWQRRSASRASGAQVEYGVALKLVELLTWPRRRRAADFALRAATLDAAHQVLKVAADVRSAYWRSVAADQISTLETARAETAKLGFELAERFHAAGNMALAERETRRVAMIEAQGRQRLAVLAQTQTRIEMARMLGLAGRSAEISLRQAEFPAPAADANDVTLLEQRALDARLDLRAARVRATKELIALGTRRATRFLGDLEAGYSSEKEPDGERLRGPAASATVPVFTGNAAQLASQEASARLARRRVEALALDVRSEVELHHAAMLSARDLILALRDQASSAHEAILDGELREFFFMIKGPFEPLAARAAALGAQVELVVAQRDYWLARTALELASGPSNDGGHSP